MCPMLLIGISSRDNLEQLAAPPNGEHAKFQISLDTLGFEPRAFRTRSGCDATTPCALLEMVKSCASMAMTPGFHAGMAEAVLAARYIAWLPSATEAFSEACITSPPQQWSGHTGICTQGLPHAERM